MKERNRTSLKEFLSISESIDSFLYNGMLEARSHPDLNPKTSIVSLLEPYKDKHSHYITFSDVEKIGINPQSTFNDTPLGLYAYPLKEIWPYLEANKVPFASDRKYVILFTANHPQLKEIQDYDDYTLKRDIDKIRKLYLDFIEEKTRLPFDSFIEQCIGIAKESKNKPMASLWAITRVLANLKNTARPHIAWNTIFREIGYMGFTDRRGYSIIHENEPIQAVFFSPVSVKLYTIAAFLNKRFSEKTSIISQINMVFKHNPKNYLGFFVKTIRELAGDIKKDAVEFSPEDLVKLLNISSTIVEMDHSIFGVYSTYKTILNSSRDYAGTLAGVVFDRILESFKSAFNSDRTLGIDFLKSYVRDEEGEPLELAKQVNSEFLKGRFSDEELKIIAKGVQ